MNRGTTFRKYEGTGNDFLVVDAASASMVSPEEAVRLCDRHFGIGADGVLLVMPPEREGSLRTMLVRNADGTTPEMCGNGLRCVALYVAEQTGQRSFTIDTSAGPKSCVVREGEVTIDMGRAEFEGPCMVAGHTFQRVRTGNPHAITFDDVLPEEARRLGPLVGNDALFPQGTNVEFARITPEGIDVFVWERGAGFTLACGTGAVATAAAAWASGRVAQGAPVRVALPGGALRIELGDGGAIRMTGPARHVFTGTLV